MIRCLSTCINFAPAHVVRVKQVGVEICLVEVQSKSNYHGYVTKQPSYKQF